MVRMDAETKRVSIFTAWKRAVFFQAMLEILKHSSIRTAAPDTQSRAPTG
jgi:hypothetical protein